MLMVTMLMLGARRALRSAKPTALSKALGCLVRDYEPAYFWWELLEAWKKLFLVGFAVLIMPGSIQQLIIAFLFSLVYMLLVSTAMPFKDDGDDYFAAQLAESTSYGGNISNLLTAGLSKLKGATQADESVALA